jgi:acetoin utilization protein AcuB
MLVQEIMTKKVVTVSPNDTLRQADQLLMQGRFRHLPVVENQRLVGIISDRDIRVPIFLKPEANATQLLEERRVEQIMKSPVITVSPGTAVEQAAGIMYEKKIGCLPVTENDHLLGIITESDIFRVFIQVMGVMIPSSRLQLLLDDRPCPLAEVTRIVKAHGINIVSLVTEPSSVANKRTVVMRLQTIDPVPVIRDLQKAGIEVVSPNLA